MSKSFRFSRLLTIKEVFIVTMSDELANEKVAKNMLCRSLAEEKFEEKLVDSRVVKTGKVVLKP